MMKYLKLILPALILVIGLMACDEFNMPENDFYGVGPPGGEGWGICSIKMDPQTLQSFEETIPDIPGNAVVYGLGEVFPSWNGTFESKDSLCLWEDIDSLEIQEWVIIGQNYPIALWVDGRTITEGITIRDTLLTWTIYDGAPPYGRLWNTFSLERYTNDSIWVYQPGDNRTQLASLLVHYDGWSNTLPDSLSYLNGPIAQQQYPAFLESNLSWGQITPLYWYGSPQNSWNKWFRVLALADTNSYYTVVTVNNQLPYIRVMGVEANDDEFHHLVAVTVQYYQFRWTITPSGAIIQGPDNRIGFTGGP